MNAPANVVRRIRVREKAEASGRRIVFYLLIAILISSMVMVYTWTFVQMAEARMVTRELRRELQSLTKELEALQAEAALLSSTVRIEKLAREKLGMILPNRVEFLSIEFVDNSPDAGESE